MRVRLVLVAAATTASLIIPPHAHATFPGSNGAIAYVKVGRQSDIYSVNLSTDPAAPSTTSRTRLTDSRRIDEGWPVWSPDGSRVAFTRFRRRDFSTNLFVMNADGTGVTRLTNYDQAVVFDPVWSPDGSRLAFVRTRGFEGGSAHIRVVDADGSNEVTLTRGRSANVEPSWTPDGETIVFSRSFEDDNFEIVSIPAGGGVEPTLLTRTPDPEFFPDVSPDGSKVLFTSYRDAALGDVYVMSIDGTGETMLTSTRQDELFPEWSPDGESISFERFGRRRGTDVWIMDADGSNPVRVGGSEVEDYGAAWAPDSSGLAYVSFRSGNGDIWFVSRDGSFELRVTSGRREESAPDWQALPPPQ